MMERVHPGKLYRESSRPAGFTCVRILRTETAREAERGWEEADGTWLLSGAPNRTHADA
ncbi:MAG: hypothetical protein ACLTBS_06545 [Eisenbergiella sp.]|nr:hypothetical protein [Bacillota bacterium]